MMGRHTNYNAMDIEDDNNKGNVASGIISLAMRETLLLVL